MLLLDEDNGGGFATVVKGHGHPTMPLEEATPKPSTTWAPPALVSTFMVPFGEQFELLLDGSPRLSLAGSPTTLPLVLKGSAAPALKDLAGLQAIVAASYELLFSSTTDATPIKFWLILDDRARALDEVILGIWDELGRHQSALNRQDQGVPHKAIEGAIFPLRQELCQDVQSSFELYTMMTNTHLTATRDIAKESKDQLEALKCRWEAAKQATERAIQLLTKHLDWAIQLLDKHLASIYVLSEDHDTQQGQMSDHLDRIIALEDSVLTLSNEEGTQINPAIAAFDTRLGQMQKAVDEIGELKSTLDDIRHRQLTKVCGNITSVQTSVDTLAGATKEGLNQVHLRVDALISSKNQSTQTLVTLPPLPSVPPTSPPPEGVQDSVHTTVILDSVVYTQSPRWDTMDAKGECCG